MSLASAAMAERPEPVMWGLLLFAVGAATVGLHLWRLAWRYLRLRWAMRTWPRAVAEVLDFRTEVSRSSRRIDVKVRYLHDGRVRETWVGSPTRSAYGRGDIQARRQVTARYPRGSTQSVFVHPASPAVAYLERPEPHMLAMLLGGGTLLLALAVTLVAPAVLGVEQDVATLWFMLTLAVVLAGIAVFAALALVMGRGTR